MLALILACLMLITATRGVWLALIVAVIAFAVLQGRDSRRAVVLSATCLLAFGILLAVPGSPLKGRASNITNTSDRTSYTWGPAIKFWLQSPIVGIGYGTGAFHAKAAEMAQADETWLHDLSDEMKGVIVNLGPHSNYLEVLSGGGLIGLCLLLHFYGRVIVSAFLSARAGNALAAAAGLAILVKYMAHGLVESINWKTMGILVGLMLASLASTARKAANSDA